MHWKTFWVKKNHWLCIYRAVFLSCHPAKTVDIHVPRKTQGVQTDTQRRSRRRLLLWRSALQFSQMLAQAFYHLLHTVICIWHARPAHILYPSLFTKLAHKHASSHSQSVVKDVSPKINKPLFKSCSSIKLIFIISAQGFVGRKYLSFICLWFTVHYTAVCIHRLYVLGRFLCVLWSDMRLCALQRWQKRKSIPSKAQNILSVGDKALRLMCVAFRTQQIWTRCQNLNVSSYIVIKCVCVRACVEEMQSNGVGTLKERGEREVIVAFSEYSSQSNVYSPLCFYVPGSCWC